MPDLFQIRRCGEFIGLIQNLATPAPVADIIAGSVLGSVNAMDDPNCHMLVTSC
jgi:hypothetical protein